MIATSGNVVSYSRSIRASVFLLSVMMAPCRGNILHINHIQELNLSKETSSNSPITATADHNFDTISAIDSQLDSAPDQDITDSEVTFTTKTSTVPSAPRYPKQVTKPPDHYQAS